MKESVVIQTLKRRLELQDPLLRAARAEERKLRAARIESPSAQQDIELELSKTNKDENDPRPAIQQKK